MSQSINYSRNNIRVNVQKRDGEWRNRVFVNGSPYTAADYFTDSKTDAIQTAQSMLESFQGHSIGYNRQQSIKSLFASQLENI